MQLVEALAGSSSNPAAPAFQFNGAGTSGMRAADMTSSAGAGASAPVLDAAGAGASGVASVDPHFAGGNQATNSQSVGLAVAATSPPQADVGGATTPDAPVVPRTPEEQRARALSTLTRLADIDAKNPGQLESDIRAKARAALEEVHQAGTGSCGGGAAVGRGRVGRDAVRELATKYGIEADLFVEGLAHAGEKDLQTLLQNSTSADVVEQLDSGGFTVRGLFLRIHRVPPLLPFQTSELRDVASRLAPDEFPAQDEVGMLQRLTNLVQAAETLQIPDMGMGSSSSSSSSSRRSVCESGTHFTAATDVLKDEYETTLLALASKRGWQSVVDYFLSHFNVPDGDDSGGGGGISSACDEVRDEIIERMELKLAADRAEKAESAAKNLAENRKEWLARAVASLEVPATSTDASGASGHGNSVSGVPGSVAAAGGTSSTVALQPTLGSGVNGTMPDQITLPPLTTVQHPGLHAPPQPVPLSIPGIAPALDFGFTSVAQTNIAGGTAISMAHPQYPQQTFADATRPLPPSSFVPFGQHQQASAPPGGELPSTTPRGSKRVTFSDQPPSFAPNSMTGAPVVPAPTPGLQDMTASISFCIPGASSTSGVAAYPAPVPVTTQPPAPALPTTNLPPPVTAPVAVANPFGIIPAGVQTEVPLGGQPAAHPASRSSGQFVQAATAVAGDLVSPMAGHAVPAPSGGGHQTSAGGAPFMYYQEPSSSSTSANPLVPPYDQQPTSGGSAAATSDMFRLGVSVQGGSSSSSQLPTAPGFSVQHPPAATSRQPGSGSSNTGLVGQMPIPNLNFSQASGTGSMSLDALRKQAKGMPLFPGASPPATPRASPRSGTPRTSPEASQPAVDPLTAGAVAAAPAQHEYPSSQYVVTSNIIAETSVVATATSSSSASGALAVPPAGVVEGAAPVQPGSSSDAPVAPPKRPPSNYDISLFRENTGRLFDSFVNVEEYDCSPRRKFRQAMSHGRPPSRRLAAYVNRPNRMGWTALLLGAKEGHAGVCKALLDHKADVDQESGATRLTPLMLAATSSVSLATVELLLMRRADVWRVNVNQQTAFEMVKNKRHMRDQKLVLLQRNSAIKNGAAKPPPDFPGTAGPGGGVPDLNGASGSLFPPLAQTRGGYALMDARGKPLDLYRIGPPPSIEQGQDFSAIEQLLQRVTRGKELSVTINKNPA